MRNKLGRRWAMLLLPALLLVASACNRNKESSSTGQVPSNGPGGSWGGSPGQGSPVRRAMSKIGQGKPPLHNLIGQELNSEMPPWDLLQVQSKDYDEAAASMGQSPPPRGEQSSWTKLTSAFAKSAQELNKAAVAKDKDGAIKAHNALSQSCKECHDAHRGRGGPGGPGGRGRPGGPPGGPPPGPPTE